MAPLAASTKACRRQQSGFCIDARRALKLHATIHELPVFVQAHAAGTATARKPRRFVGACSSRVAELRVTALRVVGPSCLVTSSQRVSEYIDRRKPSIPQPPQPTSFDLYNSNPGAWSATLLSRLLKAGFLKCVSNSCSWGLDRCQKHRLPWLLNSQRWENCRVFRPLGGRGLT